MLQNAASQGLFKSIETWQAQGAGNTGGRHMTNKPANVESLRHAKFVLGEGCQVREEDFGLLFYSMYGPRLYFLNSGERLGPDFFQGQHTLSKWLAERGQGAGRDLRALATGLGQLLEKGVIRGV